MFGYTGTITGAIPNNNNYPLPQSETTSDSNPTSQLGQQQIQNANNPISNKRRQEIGQLILSKAKRQKTTPDPTPSSQQELQSPPHQHESSSANSPSENIPSVSNALEKTSSTRLETTNPSENTSLKKPSIPLKEDIIKVLRQGGAKTASELKEELTNLHTKSRISKSGISTALIQLYAQNAISRTERKTAYNPYEYSLRTLNSEEPSKTTDSISSAQATQTIALSQLDSLKDHFHLSDLENIILEELKEQGPKTAKELHSSILRPDGTPYSISGIQRSLQILRTHEVITAKRYPGSKTLWYSIPSNTRPPSAFSLQNLKKIPDIDPNPLRNEILSIETSILADQIPVMTETVDYPFEEPIQTTTTTSLEPLSKETSLPALAGSQILNKLWLKESKRWSNHSTPAAQWNSNFGDPINFIKP